MDTDNMFIKNLRYLCLIGIISLGLMTIVGSNGGGGGGGGTTTTTTEDITAPTVSSTSPASNAIDVAINTTIIATFSEEMDGYTITTSTFTVSTGGSDISGSVTYSDTTAAFTPSSDLDYSTTYTATITTGVTDSAGNSLASDYTWNFTTGEEVDTTPSCDPYEPNYSFTEAAYLISTQDYQQYTINDSYICSPTDIDYFKINVNSSITMLTISEFEAYYGKDYDIYLYDSSFNEVAKSATRPLAGGVNTETINYYVLEGATMYVPQGTYYIKVVGYNGAYSTDKPYTLTIITSS